MKEEEEKERQRQMEEEWEKQKEKQIPELVLLKEIDSEDLEEIKGYDGEITAITFNAVKASDAFDNKKIRLEEEDLSWLDTSDYSLASADLK